MLSANWNYVVVTNIFGSNAVSLLGFKAEHSFNTVCYLTGYLQYNSQVQRSNINLRFQWRYRPMSDLFIVISQNWNAATGPGTEFFKWNTLNRSISLKWVYWLNA